MKLKVNKRKFSVMSSINPKGYEKTPLSISYFLNSVVTSYIDMQHSSGHDFSGVYSVTNESGTPWTLYGFNFGHDFSSAVTYTAQFWKGLRGASLKSTGFQDTYNNAGTPDSEYIVSNEIVRNYDFNRFDYAIVLQPLESIGVQLKATVNTSQDANIIILGHQNQKAIQY